LFSVFVSSNNPFSKTQSDALPQQNKDTVTRNSDKSKHTMPYFFRG